MALFNHSTRDLTAKIVYYGPGLCGKTTNLKVLHGQLDRVAKGKLLSLATAQDRTIYFDLLPVELGNIKGYTVRFQLCTVPGQVFYNETRKIVLRGVDGIVFVVDSQTSMLSHCVESFQNLRENLREEKISLESVPVVIQYNKRDLPSALPVATMQEALGFGAYPFVEAVASEGRGVVETFRLVSKLTFVDLLRRLQKGGPVATETAAAALAAATEAVPSLAAAVPAGTVFSHPEASPPVAAAPAPVILDPPESPAAVEDDASPVFEEVGPSGRFDGWESPFDDGFPGIDDEPPAESSLAAVGGPAGTDLATTRAIEVPAPVLLPPAEAASAILPEASSAREPPAFEPVPGPSDEETPDAEPGPEIERVPDASPVPVAAPAAEPSEERTLGVRGGPDEAESGRLEDSLTRALRSISEEAARREEVEAQLGRRIETLEEELSALRLELRESRTREEALKGLTEGLSRRWESLRRLLAEDEAPPD